MIEFLAITIVCLLVLSAGFVLAVCLAVCFTPPEIKSDYEDLYCFQCEIEMPVRIKNNKAYCSNCGLYHGEVL